MQGFKLEKERSLRYATVNYSMVLNNLDLGEYLDETLREERSEFSRALHFILSASLLRHEN